MNGDELDDRLRDALSSQRLPEARAAAMARRAISRPRLGWLAAAAAIAIVAFAGVLLSSPRPAAAESYTVVTRLDRVEVIARPRTLEPGREYVVPDGEFLRIGDRVYGPGTRVRDGRPVGAAPGRQPMLDGLRHFAQERWERAATAFREDGSADALFYLVAALGRSRQFEQAARVGERFLVANPDHPAADLVRYWHAHHLRELARVADAQAALRELIEKHPGSALVELARAQLGDGAWSDFQRAWNERRWEAARAALDTLPPAHPLVKGGDAAFYRIACVANAGDEARAIELTEAFVRDHPSHAACDYALYFKAVYQKRAGRLDDARATCRRILDAYPRSSMMPTVRALMEELK
jgi:outer membrane protein assembly factor BamD (BamD/ComL family)